MPPPSPSLTTSPCPGQSRSRCLARHKLVAGSSATWLEWATPSCSRGTCVTVRAQVASGFLRTSPPVTRRQGARAAVAVATNRRSRRQRAPWVCTRARRRRTMPPPTRGRRPPCRAPADGTPSRSTRGDPTTPPPPSSTTLRSYSAPMGQSQWTGCFCGPLKYPTRWRRPMCIGMPSSPRPGRPRFHQPWLPPKPWRGRRPWRGPRLAPCLRLHRGRGTRLRRLAPRGRRRS
mmetsp:Transcript_20283/g.50490  ORF Transcript_20283/g.50490 Transcript_20283/m.50490 type:complete len:232 (-) Transcript_20283:932-1627(-)